MKGESERFFSSWYSHDFTEQLKELPSPRFSFFLSIWIFFVSRLNAWKYIQGTGKSGKDLKMVQLSKPAAIFSTFISMFLHTKKRNPSSLNFQRRNIYLRISFLGIYSLISNFLLTKIFSERQKEAIQKERHKERLVNQFETCNFLPTFDSQKIFSDCADE